MNRKILAHYYTTAEVQEKADYVGDSLDLSIKAGLTKPDEIIFLGVRFMAETAKILNPDTQVILPDSGSTCSLVEQTDIGALAVWVEMHRERARVKFGKDLVHVSYINSSVEHKALSDIIVTSRIVDDVIKELYRQGKYVIFSPDYNMGAYLNYTYGYDMPVWSAVCEVHDKFKAEELEKALAETEGPNFVIAHPESPLPILKRADYVGSTHGMLEWVENFSGTEGTIWVATEDGLLYNMSKVRPDLDIRQAPMYSGCQCNSCPYMKLNTLASLEAAPLTGERILISEELMQRARAPINRMMEFQRTGRIEI